MAGKLHVHACVFNAAVPKVRNSATQISQARWAHWAALRKQTIGQSTVLFFNIGCTCSQFQIGEWDVFLAGFSSASEIFSRRTGYVPTEVPSEARFYAITGP